MAFDEVLINEIRKYVYLYDKRQPAYRNKIKREKAWENISHVTGETKEACQTRWKSLRDKFVKENRKQASGSAAEGEKRKWLFLDDMMFLKDHVAPRQTISNVSFPDREEYIMEEDTLETSIIEMDVSNYLIPTEHGTREPLSQMNQEDVESSSETVSSSSRNKRQKNNSNERFCSFLDKVEGILNKNFSQAGKENEGEDHKEFLNIIGKYINKVPENKKDSLKVELINFVHNKVQEYNN